MQKKDSVSFRNRINATVRDIPRSGIRDFFDIVSTMKDVISLGIGEPDFDTPWHVREATVFALERGATHYTSNLGYLDLRRALARYVHKAFGCEYNPCAGVSAGCQLPRRECNRIYLPGQETNIMSNERMRVVFPTEAQANAFIEGIEYLEDDHVMTEGPEADLDSEGAVEYAVFIRRFA